MNWIEGLGTWSFPPGMEFLGAKQKDGKAVSPATAAASLRKLLSAEHGQRFSAGAVQFPQLEQFNFRNWSSLSAYAFSLHTQVTGDNALRMQVKKILRNLLCLFFPDGTASCAYLHPYSVTMLNPDGSEIAPARRGEFFDPWANDQDFALYYILRAEDETDLSLKGKR